MDAGQDSILTLAKSIFIIIDLRDVCRLFADPAFDGELVVVTDGGDGWSVYPDNPIIFEPPIIGETTAKYRVRGVSVKILNERVQYYDKDGKLITESIKDCSKRNILDRKKQKERPFASPCFE